MTVTQANGGPSRRTVLGGATVAGVAGAATATGLGGAAHAAVPQLARGASSPRLLSAAGRHLVGRFSYGVTPALADRVRAAGGPRAWFEQQLDPGSVRDGATDDLVTWWPGLSKNPQELWQRNISGVEAGWEVMAHYQRWVLMRRIVSHRQLLETMTEFWENHFNVPATGDAPFTHRIGFGKALRKRALGTFEELLQAAVLHPAMLIYLDNAVSTKSHPNENLGRELLELHTVGRGNHDEDDVKASARILTGWRVDVWNTWDAYYDAPSHWTGPVQVLDFAEANGAADGRDLTRRYLTYLAHHPATARRVARKLAVKFVRDDPPDALVDHLAEVYLAHDTAIKPVLRALVDTPEFAAARGAKVRDPGEDIVATYRALGIRVQRPTSDSAAANAILWQVSELGARPFGWPRPDGQPLDNGSWSSPSRMIASLGVHRVLAGGWWPTVDVDYRRPEYWVPSFPVRFEDLVDHVSRRLLHRPATAALVEACCAAVECTRGERITRDHPLMQWKSPRFLTTFLDSPAFFAR